MPLENSRSGKVDMFETWVLMFLILTFSFLILKNC